MTSGKCDFIQSLLGLRLLVVAIALLMPVYAYSVGGIKSNSSDPHFSRAENLESFEDMRVKVLGGHVRMTRRWNGRAWQWNTRWHGLSLGGNFSIAEQYEQLINQGDLDPVILEEENNPPPMIYRAGQLYIFSNRDETSVTYENRLRNFITWSEEGYLWRDSKGNKIQYDKFGRIQSYQNKNNNNVSFLRNDNGYITSVLDHHGTAVITYNWENDSQQESQLNLQGEAYQPQRLKSLIDYSGRVVSYHYNSQGLLSGITDVLEEDWQLEYTDENLLKKIIDPDGRVTTYDITSEGRVMSIIDNDDNGVNYTYNYDEANNRFYRSEQYASGKVVEKWYNAIGQISSQSVNGQLESQSDNTLSDGSFGVDNLINRYASARVEYYRDDTLIRIHWIVGPGGCAPWDLTGIGGNIGSDPGAVPGETNTRPSCSAGIQSTSSGTSSTGSSTTSALYIKYRVTRDAVGRKTSRAFDQRGNLTKITHPDGTTETTTWNTQYSLPLTHTDERGTVTAYEYDDKGNLLTLTEAQGTADERITRYTYDQYGQMREMTTGESAAGNTELATTLYEYDSYGNLIRLTDPEGHITTYSDYDALGNARTVRDARAHEAGEEYTWSRTYDAAGNLLSDLNPDGEGETFTYTPAGDILTLDSATTGTYTLETNARSLPTAVIDPEERKTTLEYDRQYRLTGVVDAMGHAQRLQYNHQDQPSKVIDGEGNEIRMEYELNQLKSIHYPTYSESLAYDARERVNLRTRAGNDRQYFTRYQYDKTGNLSEHTDAKGQPEQYQHDRLGRLIKIVDAEQGETQLAYDARNNLLSVTDPEGRVTRYRYNRNDQRTAEIKPAAEPASVRQYDYDANGNLVEEITPAGEVKRYDYDRANRLVGMTLFVSEQAQQPVKRVTYQVAGRSQYRGYQQTLGEDAQNRTADIQALSESYTYNDLGQVTSVTVNFGPFSKTYQYTYHPNGLKKTYTTPEGITYTYYYNKNNQFTAVHIPGSGQLSRGSFYWLQPQTLLLPGGSQVTLSYDDFLQVKERILQDPEQENVAQAIYDYDAVGDITAIDTEHGQYSFDYDRLYRLTGADYPLTVAANDETFDYDGVGNRTGHTQTPEEGEAEAINATYNNLNQLVSQTKDGVETTFTYNTNGHTATKTTAGETTEYIYNHEERLIAVKKNGTTVGEYAYNPLGQRIKKTVNGQTTWYLYNDEGLAAEYNAYGQLLAEYHFTPYSTWMTDPLFQRRNGQVYYYQNDHLGTPQRMINSSGEVVWEARYEAFGEAEIINEAVTNNLRFPGQYYDTETGLHHNYFRDYEPGLGRYVQGDPIGLGDGVNSYIYVYSNPTYTYDPTGEFGIFGAIAGAMCTALTGGSPCEIMASAASGFFGFLGGAIVGQMGAQICKDPDDCAVEEAASQGAESVASKLGTAYGESPHMMNSSQSRDTARRWSNRRTVDSKDAVGMSRKFHGRANTEYVKGRTKGGVLGCLAGLATSF